MGVIEVIGDVWLYQLYVIISTVYYYSTHFTMRAARVGNDIGNLTDVVYFSMCSREYELQWTSGVAHLHIKWGAPSVSGITPFTLVIPKSKQVTTGSYGLTCNGLTCNGQSI